MGKELYKFNVKDMCEIAILCAIAVVFDIFIRIPFAPTGGSINISVVPIFIIGLRHGWFKSFIAGGIIFGGITCLIDGYGIATFPLEYFVAFGSISIIGLLAKSIYKLYRNSKRTLSLLLIFLVVIIWAIIRIICGTIDSIILWEYPLIEALIYNLGYVGISAIIDGIVLSIMFPIIVVINNKFQTSFIRNMQLN